MVLEELITKYKKSKLYSLNGVVTIENVIKDLEQLRAIEYNHKVKVPPKIDEYIRLCEVHGFCLKSALNFHMIKEKEYWRTARKWILENEKLFAEAWANGCEAEEEPKFYVVNSKGKYFCNMGFSIKHNFISNVIWQRDSKFEFKTKEAAEAVILLVGGKVEEHNV